MPSSMTWVMEQSVPYHIHRWNANGTSSQYADGPGCYSEGSWQAKEMGWQDLHEDQQKQIYCASNKITPCINKGWEKLSGR